MANVLVVDHEEGANRLLCQMLERLGHRCQGAYSGRGALDVLRASRPDLVLLRFMLPESDGLEVLREIRADPQLRGRPVILFSSIADPAFRKYVLDSGADDYWVRGAMDLRRLAEMIERHAR